MECSAIRTVRIGQTLIIVVGAVVLCEPACDLGDHPCYLLLSPIAYSMTTMYRVCKFALPSCSWDPIRANQTSRLYLPLE